MAIAIFVIKHANNALDLLIFNAFLALKMKRKNLMASFIRESVTKTIVLHLPTKGNKNSVANAKKIASNATLTRIAKFARPQQYCSMEVVFNYAQ